MNLLKKNKNISTNISRNPNEGTPDPGPTGSRPDRTKLKNVAWTAYEEKHKNYLIIGERATGEREINFW